MAETHRTRSSLLGLAPVGVDEGTSAQDVRDFMQSAHITRTRTVTSLTDTGDSDDDYVRLDTTSNAVTETLPPLADANDQPYTYKWVAGANTATLDGDSSEQIEGSGTYVFTTLGDAVVLRPGPTQWEIVSEFLNA